MSQVLGVAFQHFWKDFHPDDFFLPLVSNALNGYVEERSRHEADLIVSSVFISRSHLLSRVFRHGLIRQIAQTAVRRRARGQIMLWFSGETDSPQAGFANVCWSMTNEYNVANWSYFPAFLLGLTWPELPTARTGAIEKRRLGLSVSPDDLVRQRQVDTHLRRGFACAFVGNMTPDRLAAIRSLGTLGTVDIYGESVGKPVSSKSEVARDYRFMLCFENEPKPGVITEKVIDAWSLGCIPIWKGIDSHGVLNSEALVNACEFPGIGDMASRVAQIDSDSQTIREMAARPIVTRRPTIQNFKEQLRASLLNKRN